MIKKFFMTILVVSLTFCVFAVEKITNGFIIGFKDAPWGYNPSKLFAGDCDGDRKDDLMMVADNGWHSASISDGNMFIEQISVQIGTGYSTIVGDFNGDRRKDFAAYSPNGNCYLIKSTGNAFAAVSNAVPSGYNPAKLFAGDCNGDGKDDLMMVADNGWHSASISDGTKFYKQIAVQIGTGYSTIVGDFNGDGKKDFAAYSPNGNCYLIKSTGNGFTAVSNAAPSGYNPSKLFAGDCDGDRKDDLMMVADNGWHSASISDGTKFYKQIAVQIGTGYSTIVGDFNGDGKKDFAAYAANGNCYLIKSTGNGFAAVSNAAPSGYNPSKLFAGDFDGDGKDDLMMVADNGWHSASISDGTKFYKQIAVKIGTGYSTIVGDFNDGGKKNFAAYETSGHSYLIKYIIFGVRGI